MPEEVLKTAARPRGRGRPRLHELLL